MSESNNRSPLTLEDLLRLKRAERPSPEFWNRFEVELRQKQLAALIDRRPWWQTFPRYLAKPRMFLPLGATAVLALTLLSANYFKPASVTPPDNLSSVPSALSTSSSTAMVADATPEIPATMITSPLAVLPEFETDATVVASVSLSEQLPEHAAELTLCSASRPVQSPAAKLFAADAEMSSYVEPHMAQPLTVKPVPVALSRTPHSAGAVAELASVSALSSKRTRLLAQFNERQFSPEPQAPAPVRERLTRRLASTDTNYTEHFTRVGLKGDQVSLRF